MQAEILELVYRTQALLLRLCGIGDADFLMKILQSRAAVERQIVRNHLSLKRAFYLGER
jgi:hypothetical protein